MTGPLKDASMRVRVDQLERRLAALDRRVEASATRAARMTWPREIWLGKTTHDAESYPDPPANCYEVELVDGSYTEAVGDQTVTYTDRGKIIYAVTLPTQYLVESTYVVVVKMQRQFWILASLGLQLWRFSLNEAFSGSPSSADADLLELDGTDTNEDIELYDYLDVFSADLSTNDVGYCIKQNGVYVAIQAPCP